MSTIVSLSGGKDSTAMLLMMLERGEQIDDIVFFDWRKEYPELYDHLTQLESHIERPITRIYPPNTWEFYRDEYVLTKGKRKGQIGYGDPHPIAIWCKRIKVATLRRFCKGLITCIGIAVQEKRRARYVNNSRYPLLELGVCSSEALKYCYSKGFSWGGLYEVHKKLNCGGRCPNWKFT